MNNIEKEYIQRLRDALNVIQSVAVSEQVLESVCYDTKRALDMVLRKETAMPHAQEYINRLNKVAETVNERTAN